MSKNEELLTTVKDIDYGEIIGIDDIEKQFPNINRTKLYRKLDLYLMPGVTILYLLSFIDRGNIGNAKIEGLADDIGLVGNQFNMALTVFYFTYSPFEIPSTYLMTRLRPSIYLPIMMICWGAVIACTGLVKNYTGLIVCRVLLGVAESGLFPSVAYYLTRWYPKSELQYRQALFYGAASMAGAWSGILAYGIKFMDGIGGIRGWQYIFILEGCATAFVAFTSFFYIFDYPDTAKFITQEEREYIEYMLYRDNHDIKVSSFELTRDQQVVVSSSKLNDTITLQPGEPKVKSKYHHLILAFKDWQCYFHILVHWSCVTTIYALSVFLPTIIKNMGYSSANAQLMSIPPYIAASICTIIVAKLADRYQLRSPFLMGCHVLMIVGYLITITTDVSKHPNTVYGGIFITTVFAFCGFPSMITWLANNLAGPEKRAAGMGIQIGIGNLSGCFCVNFFRSQDSPNYRLGYGLEIMFVSIGLLTSLGLNIAYYFINKRKQRQIDEGKYTNYTEDQLRSLGDKSPYFKYSH